MRLRDGDLGFEDVVEQTHALLIIGAPGLGEIQLARRAMKQFYAEMGFQLLLTADLATFSRSAAALMVSASTTLTKVSIFSSRFMPLPAYCCVIENMYFKLWG